MDAVLSKPPIKKRILDKKDAEGIKAAYHITDQDISAARESSEPPTTTGCLRCKQLLALI